MSLARRTDIPPKPIESRLKNRLQRIVFDATSRWTTWSPRGGSRCLDGVLLPLAGSSLLTASFERYNRRIMKDLLNPARFLVIPDIHIGDAVMSQAALTAIRDFFPEAEVDYVVNRTAHPVIDGNPEATRVLPFFEKSAFPSPADLQALRSMIRAGAYDLVLNFCPYIGRRDLVPRGGRVLDFLSHGSVIVGNERRPAEVNHFAYQTYMFTRRNLAASGATPHRADFFPGLRLTLGDRAVETAARFAAKAGLPPGAPVLMVNPDAASPFTRMPFAILTSLLTRAAQSASTILLGAGHSEPGLGERLLAALPDRLRKHVRIVPASIPLDAYAAVIDLADVFVSADTGPLHMAAARKHSPTGRHTFRNRTAVVGVFGATPARMSGYDSARPGFLPANQEAPSASYAAGSPCRNITCLNKVYKTCRIIRCFEDLDVEGMQDWISRRLEASAVRRLQPHDAASGT